MTGTRHGWCLSIIAIGVRFSEIEAVDGNN